MRRYTLEQTGHRAQNVTTKAAYVEAQRHMDIFPTVDLHSEHGYSPKKVRVREPGGFASIYPPIQKGQQKEAKNATPSGSAAGGSSTSGGSVSEGQVDHNQPEGEAAEGHIGYIGALDNPYTGQHQYPPGQLVFGYDGTKQQQQESSSGGGQQSGSQQQQMEQLGWPGDVCFYQMVPTEGTQLQGTAGDGKDLKPGWYMSVDKTKSKMKFQCVDLPQQQGSGQQSGGGSQSGSQQQQKGQRPLLKQPSTIYIEIDGGNTITVKHGDSVVIVTGSKVVAYQGDQTKSMRVDANHTHIRHGGNRIFVDAQGCSSSSEIKLKSCNDD